MKSKSMKKKFQCIVQVGNFPHISFYHVSAPRFPTREAAIAAGELILTERGIEISQKFIHTRMVYRGPSRTEKLISNQQLTKQAKLTPRWIIDKDIRKELGIKELY